MTLVDLEPDEEDLVQDLIPDEEPPTEEREDLDPDEPQEPPTELVQVQDLKEKHAAADPQSEARMWLEAAAIYKQQDMRTRLRKRNFN